MVDSPDTDVVMFIEPNGAGSTLRAECPLIIADTDKDGMMKEFKSYADLSVYSNFFQLTDFDLDLELSSKDQQSGSGHTQGNASLSSGSGFSRWYLFKDKKNNETQNAYVVKKASGSFSRFLDAASPMIFEYCCKKAPFTRAIIVKRVNAGLATSTDADTGATHVPLAYLRVEFKEFRVTNVTWSDGDLVTESCQFTCQEVNILLRKQNDDGSLDTATSSLSWKADAAERPAAAT